MKGFVWLLAGIAALSLIALGIPPANERECLSEESAYEYAKKMVEYRLRSPSTAEWQSQSEAIILSQDEMECGYQIFSHVDAQNSFGAMIRQDFTITVQFEKESSKWAVRSLNM
jgi:hypothetical protein